MFDLEAAKKDRGCGLAGGIVSAIGTVAMFGCFGYAAYGNTDTPPKWVFVGLGLRAVFWLFSAEIDIVRSARRIARIEDYLASRGGHNR